MEELEFEAEGYKCFILWVNESHYCGYVAIPKEHPAYGKSYYTYSVDFDDVTEGFLKQKPILEAINDIEVHGGITYADNDLRDKVKPEDNLWLFGFDASHAWDKTLSEYSYGSEGATFKDRLFMKEQCEKLAKQLKEIEVKYNEQV